jgi:ABC-type uncharacterized transport system permease subunit
MFEHRIVVDGRAVGASCAAAAEQGRKAVRTRIIAALSKPCCGCCATAAAGGLYLRCGATSTPRTRASSAGQFLACGREC